MGRRSYIASLQNVYDKRVIGKRKALTLPLEQWFLIVLMEFGEPSREPYRFQGPKFHAERGVDAWIKYTAKGERFLLCVTNYGEGKIRARLLYSLYCKWWERCKKRKLNGRFTGTEDE